MYTVNEGLYKYSTSMCVFISVLVNIRKKTGKIGRDKNIKTNAPLEKLHSDRE